MPDKIGVNWNVRCDENIVNASSDFVGDFTMRVCEVSELFLVADIGNTPEK